MGKQVIPSYMIGIGTLLSVGLVFIVTARFQGAKNRYVEARDIANKMTSLASGEEHLKYSDSMSKIYGIVNQFENKNAFLKWFKQGIRAKEREPNWIETNKNRTVCLEYKTQVKLVKDMSKAFLSQVTQGVIQEDNVKGKGNSVSRFYHRYILGDYGAYYNVARVTHTLESKLSEKSGYELLTQMSKLFDPPRECK